jgi:hypothetical protein
MKHAEESIIDCLARADVAGMRMMFENYYQALCIFALRYWKSRLKHKHKPHFYLILLTKLPQ